MLVPDNRGPEPKAAPIATEPLVRLNESGQSADRDVADLVQSPHEMSLVEYYSTGQLAIIDVKSGTGSRRSASRGIIRSLDASPDAKLFRITYHRQAVLLLPSPELASGRPRSSSTSTGKVVYQVAEAPASRLRPCRHHTGDAGTGGRGAGWDHAPDTGKRSLTWHPVDNAMIYMQLAPAAAGAKNDSASVAQRHDRLIEWSPPFDSTSTQGALRDRPTGSPSRPSSMTTAHHVCQRDAVPAGTAEYAIYLDEGGKKYEVVKPTGGRGSAGGRGGRRWRSRRPRRVRAGGGSGFVTKAGSRGVPVVMISTDGKYVFVQGRRHLACRAGRTAPMRRT